MDVRTALSLLCARVERIVDDHGYCDRQSGREPSERATISYSAGWFTVSITVYPYGKAGVLATGGGHTARGALAAFRSCLDEIAPAGGPKVGRR